MPETHRSVGSFEDPWELGCWLGCMARLGGQLVGTSRGVCKLSTVMRRPPEESWCTELVQGVKGSTAEPILGLGSRHITAFAKNVQDEPSKDAVCIPAPEPPRRARCACCNVERRGGSERCSGCKASKYGTYRAKHASECKRRFECIQYYNKMCEPNSHSTSPTRGESRASTRRSWPCRQKSRKPKRRTRPQMQACKTTPQLGGGSSGSG